MSDEARKTQLEAETLAILEAERLGKSVSRAASTPKAKIGSPEWAREFEELEAQREKDKVYQLAFWPDNKRAMPADFLACALFAAIQDKDASYFDGVEIANANGFQITFRGKRLTQVHADVWEGIMHLARQCEQGSIVRFTSRQLLRLIGRLDGKSQRDQLKSWIGELVATNVEIIDTKNKRRYFGSLLPRGAADDAGENASLYAVEINRDIARLFNYGFATIDWEQRRRLQKKPLALWLQHYFSKFTKPVAVTELHRLAGSGAELKEFRRKLRKALAELEAEKVLGAWRLDQATDTVHITSPAKAEALALRTPVSPALPAPGQTALPLIPPVSERARARFRELYPERDAERCLADFAAWLAKKGHTADKPDSAWLGFAAKWAANF